MAKYRLQVRVEDYWDYVVEAKDKQEAEERAYVDFREVVADLHATVEVEDAPDDAPLGDV